MEEKIEKLRLERQKLYKKFDSLYDIIERKSESEDQIEMIMVEVSIIESLGDIINLRIREYNKKLKEIKNDKNNN